MNWGMRVAVPGIMIMETRTINKKLLPGPLSRAKPNPARALVKVVNTVVTLDRKREFLAYLKKGAIVSARR